MVKIKVPVRLILPCLSPWLIEGHLPPVSSQFPSVHVCVHIASSYKDISDIG